MFYLFLFLFLLYLFCFCFVYFIFIVFIILMGTLRFPSNTPSLAVTNKNIYLRTILDWCLPIGSWDIGLPILSCVSQFLIDGLIGWAALLQPACKNYVNIPSINSTFLSIVLLIPTKKIGITYPVHMNEHSYEWLLIWNFWKS